jgi:hypothetical protein
MSKSSVERLIRLSQAWALVVLPSLLILVFALHFRRLSDFFEFHMAYTPRPAESTVRALVRIGESRLVLHDPHMLAYLGLPLFLLVAFGLYALGRRVRPLASLIGIALTTIGTIYIAGLFSAWTAFFGIGLVDPQYLEGATAAFAALTAPRGALLITTSLAKLSMIGIGFQSLVLLRTRTVPSWSPILIACGCALFLAFWDLDNWMLIGSALVLAGFIPMRSRLLQLAPDSSSVANNQS